MKKLKIYVASSWRNAIQPGIVALLRQEGHEVYDFRHPHATGPDRGRRGVGFSWSELDENWKSWTPRQFRNFLASQVADDAFNSDLDAIKWCDALIMVQPCGRSAAMELGYACGMGKPCAVRLAEEQEPELMLAIAGALCVDDYELLGWVRATAMVWGASVPANDTDRARAPELAVDEPARWKAWAGAMLAALDSRFSPSTDIDALANRARGAGVVPCKEPK